MFTRWGDSVEIVAQYGDQYNGLKYLTLVKVRYGPGSVDQFQFAQTMRAAGGWPEIKRAVDALPVSKISGTALQRAIKEAQ